MYLHFPHVKLYTPIIFEHYKNGKQSQCPFTELINIQLLRRMSWELYIHIYFTKILLFLIT